MPLNRAKTARQIEQLGQEINAVRQDLLNNDAPFTAGILRAAEESLLAAMNGLDDTSVTEEDL